MCDMEHVFYMNISYVQHMNLAMATVLFVFKKKMGILMRKSVYYWGRWQTV